MTTLASTPTRFETGLYRLVGFAPFSGIGFFVYGEQLYRIDLIRDETVPLSTSPSGPLSPAELGVVECDVRFQTLKALSSELVRKSLLVKKQQYLTALATKTLDHGLFEEIADFLNSDDVAELALPQRLTSQLRSVANPDTIQASVKRADNLGFRSVARLLESLLVDSRVSGPSARSRTRIAAPYRQRRYVYSFGGGTTDGDGKMKDVLGGKGAGLAEISKAGVPVPPGFTISTEVCNLFFENGNRVPQEVDDQIHEALAELEKLMGKKLGAADDPLLVSVRSSAKFSMPGMMRGRLKSLMPTPGD